MLEESFRLQPLKGRIDMKASPLLQGMAGTLSCGIPSSLEEGEGIVIVGRTGCGKTVFCNLLAEF